MILKSKRIIMGSVNCVNREAKYVGDITSLSSCHVVLGSHLFKESLNIYLAFPGEGGF